MKSSTEIEIKPKALFRAMMEMCQEIINGDHSEDAKCMMMTMANLLAKKPEIPESQRAEFCRLFHEATRSAGCIGECRRILGSNSTCSI